MSEQNDHAEVKPEGALLSWIQRLAPYGIITLDVSFQVQSWNHWMELHSGLRLEQVAGQSLFALFPELNARKLVSPFERALKGEASVLSTALHQYLLPLHSPLSGPEIANMRQTVRIAPLVSEGAVCGIVVVIEDVTQRELQAEALSRQHRRDEVLSWALAHFLKSDAPRKTIRQLFFKIAEHLDFDTFLLYLRDMDTGTLSLYTSGGILAEAEADFAEYPLLVRVADFPETIIFSGVQQRLEPEYDAFKKARIASAVAIPLSANDRSLGLLCFATWNRDVIAPEESTLLATIAQYLATAVDRENTSQELKRARELLVGHAQTLERKVLERTAKLQETVSELETFSYTLAHDLKAPVRGMIGYCQVLLEDFADQMSADAIMIVEKLVRTPRRMETLIQNLLEFSKVSRQEVVLSRVEIEPVIDDLLAFRLPAIRLAVTIRSPLHAVRGHRALLQQVLSNLIDNACKFVVPQAEPAITICTEIVREASPSSHPQNLLFSSTESIPRATVDTTTEARSRRVRIWIMDRGIGIPAEAHSKIFGIFERGITADSYEGTGMGLAIVARAMQRMGGTCGVESEPGKGSRFWIELREE